MNALFSPVFNKDVLWELEVASRTKFAEKTPMPAGLWTEHVLPQSWTEAWPFEDGLFVGKQSGDPKAIARDSLLQTIGNLTLLTGGLNISAGNKGFLEKRGKLEEHTGLFLNKWFLKVAVWNEAAITSRGEALADIAVKIWPALPEQVVQNEEGTSL